MGYTTEFTGKFNLDATLLEKHENYLIAFASIRHMRRNAEMTEKMVDNLRKNVGLPVGEEGEYFVGSYFDGDFGQGRTPDIVDYNSPPIGQPGLWCQWVPSKGGTGIEWDGNEKFYDYVKWLRYLIKHFLAPWGYTMNGEVSYHGEDPNDFGKIKVVNNVVSISKGKIAYE